VDLTPLEKVIESYCNCDKPHSSVGWVIPTQFMDELFERTTRELYYDIVAQSRMLKTT
jgi:hypothetical protein